MSESAAFRQRFPPNAASLRTGQRFGLSYPSPPDNTETCECNGEEKKVPGSGTPNWTAVTPAIGSEGHPPTRRLWLERGQACDLARAEAQAEQSGFPRVKLIC